MAAEGVGVSDAFGPNPGDNASVDEAAVATGMYENPVHLRDDGIYEYPALVVQQRAQEARHLQARAEGAEELVAAILMAVCTRDGLSLDSEVDPGTPARNYELMDRLGIGHVIGLGERR